jgi:hypothetical protein
MSALRAPSNRSKIQSIILLNRKLLVLEAPDLLKLPMFNNLYGDRNVVDLTENRETKKKDVQKEDTLQPITKVNSKLDKELQDWEVDSTMSGD